MNLLHKKQENPAVARKDALQTAYTVFVAVLIDLRSTNFVLSQKA